MNGGEKHLSRWWLERRFVWMLWLLAALMAAQGVYKLAVGLNDAWIREDDIDLQMRWAEYQLFRAEFYPNARIEMPPEGVTKRWTVYPPYAFPMLVALFEPGGLLQGRIVLFALTIASIVLVGAYGFRLLRPAGLPVAVIGALVGFAISGNRGVFALGQFAILCVGFLMLQLHFVAKGRPVLAGICWGLAMLKPHVALPFAVLFLLRRQWPGLIAGSALLAGLSWAACAWTGHDVVHVVKYFTTGMSMAFSVYGFGLGPGSLAAATGIDERIMQKIMLGVVVLVAIAAALFVRRLSASALLPLAGVLGTAGLLGFYHRLYDQIMLLPMVLAAMAWAVRVNRPAAFVIAFAALVSVLVPTRYFDTVAAPVAIATTVWIVAALYPFAAVVLEERRRKTESS